MRYLASHFKQTSGLHSLLEAQQGHPEWGVQSFRFFLLWHLQPLNLSEPFNHFWRVRERLLNRCQVKGKRFLQLLEQLHMRWHLCCFL